jgi:hypothetical protein
MFLALIIVSTDFDIFILNQTKTLELVVLNFTIYLPILMDEVAASWLILGKLSLKNITILID